MPKQSSGEVKNVKNDEGTELEHLEKSLYTGKKMKVSAPRQERWESKHVDLLFAIGSFVLGLVCVVSWMKTVEFFSKVLLFNFLILTVIKLCTFFK